MSASAHPGALERQNDAKGADELNLIDENILDELDRWSAFQGRPRPSHVQDKTACGLDPCLPCLEDSVVGPRGHGLLGAHRGNTCAALRLSSFNRVVRGKQ